MSIQPLIRFLLFHCIATRKLVITSKGLSTEIFVRNFLVKVTDSSFFAKNFEIRQAHALTCTILILNSALSYGQLILGHFSQHFINLKNSTK